MNAIIYVFCFLFIVFCSPLFAQQQVNSNVENENESCSVTLPTSFTTANANLPDPFTKLDGQRMTSKEEWPCRRQELLKLLERTVYGTKPAKPASVTGTVSRTSISTTVGSANFSVSITMPSGGSAPYPLVIRYDNSGVPAANFTSNGVAVANLTTSNVGGGTRTAKTGAFYTANSGSSKTGHLAAWAWGVSRIIDVIEADPDKLFDPTKIGVTGCSRDGKGAFAAGVLDQRVALTMPMESGTGGMASMRVAYNDRPPSGTDGAQSPSSAYSEQPWLGDDFSAFQNSPNNLPIDMHEAVALVAPRGFLAVYKTASSAGKWLNVPGSHVSAVAGAEVYKALGYGGNFGWMNTGTESHCQWTNSYNNTVKDFVDEFLHRNKAVTRTVPLFTENNRPTTAASMINWETPDLSDDLEPVEPPLPPPPPPPPTPAPECAEYKTEFCGGMEFEDVLGNSDAIPGTGDCVFIGDFEAIQPDLNSTVAINGLENTCGGEWGEEPGKCMYNAKPEPKDGGYYVYVKTGNINAYRTNPPVINGWQDIVAKAKITDSDCETITPIFTKTPMLQNKPIRYYTLKGEPLGSKQPSKPGVYIVKEGYSVKKIAVK